MNKFSFRSSERRCKLTPCLWRFRSSLYGLQRWHVSLARSRFWPTFLKNLNENQLKGSCRFHYSGQRLTSFIGRIVREARQFLGERLERRTGG
jgi:hypothetical protein